MPTRILYWNIQQFSIAKVNSVTAVNNPVGGRATRGQDRLHHIINEVVAQINPDIFVIVEVQAGGGYRQFVNEGQPILGQFAQRASMIILQQLRALPNPNPAQPNPHQNWCLIPPINVGGGGGNNLGFAQGNGMREGIAVYYRSDKLQFIGPYVMTSFANVLHAKSPNQPNLTVGDLADYPAWANGAFGGAAMPNNIPRTHNIGRLGGQGRPVRVRENQFAGQYAYYPLPNPPLPLPLPNQGNRIHFPNANNRSPYLTSFIDLNHPNNRIIKLFSFHSSPGTADDAVARLAQIPEIQNVAANEVSVIVGDFNVDSFVAYARPNPAQGFNNPNQTNPYFGLTNTQNYTMHLSPLNAGALSNDRKPYCSTHYLPVLNQLVQQPDFATPLNNMSAQNPPMTGDYPSYGFMSNNGAIDNIFTRYGNNANPIPPNNPNITIANTLTGKPYNTVMQQIAANPPWNAVAQIPPVGVTNELTGGHAVPSTLQNLVLPLPDPLNLAGYQAGGYPDTPAANPVQHTRVFSEWHNFERIRSTSDHLAISIDV